MTSLPEASVCDCEYSDIDRTVPCGDDVFIYFRTIVISEPVNDDVNDAVAV